MIDSIIDWLALSWLTGMLWLVAILMIYIIGAVIVDLIIDPKGW